MSTEKMREEFEAFVAGYPSLAQYGFEKYPAGGDEYDAIALQDAWKSWQASRAALVINLPPVRASFQEDWIENRVAVFTRDDALEAIGAAGVKAK